MGCTHDCDTCSSACNGKSEEASNNPDNMIEKLNELSSVKKVIGVVSGKGGVGKSLVTSMMAVLMNRRGYHTAILDADITGPSIPKAFNISGRAEGSDEGIYPRRTKMGIDIMSVNLLLEDATDPVIWRGPIIAGAVKQFWTDVIWNEVDFMFVDMPPGTGDVPLTVFQSIPLDGILVVTSPQELVSMIVGKAVKMANKMDIPVLGLVENMSYAVCPDCNKHINVFGESHIEQTAADHHLPVLAKLPIDPAISKQVDMGLIELFEGDWLDSAADIIEKI